MGVFVTADLLTRMGMALVVGALVDSELSTVTDSMRAAWLKNHHNKDKSKG